MVEIRLTNAEAKDGCGIGQGARCCKFLLHDGDSFLCGRYTDLHFKLLYATDYTAERKPTEPYPQCQLPKGE